MYIPTLSHSPAEVDYEAVHTTLTFNESVLAQVVTIPIFDDHIVENNKSFSVTLRTSDTTAILKLQTASVIIRDNDGKLEL